MSWNVVTPPATTWDDISGIFSPLVFALRPIFATDTARWTRVNPMLPGSGPFDPAVFDKFPVFDTPEWIRI